MRRHASESRQVGQIPLGTSWSRLGRWALVTDSSIDDGMCHILGATRLGGAVAVLVDPRYLLHAQAVVPDRIRCVTHPNELRLLRLDVCVIWGRGGALLAQAEVLRRFAEVLWVDESGTVPSLYRPAPPSGLERALARST